MWQRLEVHGAGRFIVSAPTKLPGELPVDRIQCGRIAAVDEFERVAELVDRRLAEERAAEQSVDAANAFGGGVCLRAAIGLFGASCEGGGLFDRERAVHEEE